MESRSASSINRETMRRAWIDGDTASPRLAGSIDALKHAEDHGLDPRALRRGATFSRMVEAAAANKETVRACEIPEPIRA